MNNPHYIEDDEEDDEDIYLVDDFELFNLWVNHCLEEMGYTTFLQSTQHLLTKMVWYKAVNTNLYEPDNP